MSRPPAPSLRPVRNVIPTVVGPVLPGRLLAGAAGAFVR